MSLRSESKGDPPSIDIAVLSRQTLGDRALQADVLRLFSEQAEAFAALVEAGQDRAAVLTGLHRLKGAARAIGANSVAAAAEELEGGLSLQSDEAAFDPSLSDPVRSAIADACRFAAMWLGRFG